MANEVIVDGTAKLLQRAARLLTLLLAVASYCEQYGNLQRYADALGQVGVSVYIQLKWWRGRKENASDMR